MRRSRLGPLSATLSATLLAALSATLLAAIAAGGVTIAATTAARAQEPKRAITKIAGDLYRFQNNFHFSVFLVTPDGVIATDPINAEAAAWLEAEIESRFGQPVKYLVLSHDHPDHSSGGEVFADTAVVVAHENATRTILGERRPTAVPSVAFSDTMTIELGGKTVELVYVGPSHSDNMIVMHFPAERTVYAVDFVSVDRLPYRTLNDAYFPGWMEALEKLEAIDFDILAPGHGSLGTKADVAPHRRYLEELHAAVLAGLRAGQSVEEMQASILLEDYAHWSQHEKWRPLNIQGMAANIGLHRRGN